MKNEDGAAVTVRKKAAMSEFRPRGEVVGRERKRR